MTGRLVMRGLVILEVTCLRRVVRAPLGPHLGAQLLELAPDIVQLELLVRDDPVELLEGALLEGRTILEILNALGVGHGGEDTPCPPGTRLPYREVPATAGRVASVAGKMALGSPRVRPRPALRPLNVADRA